MSLSRGIGKEIWYILHNGVLFNCEKTNDVMKHAGQRMQVEKKNHPG